MSRAYQQAFDALYQFCQDSGSKLSERSFEWESGGGNHRQRHLNHMITVEVSLGGRPTMLIHQDDPPNPDETGLEIFLSAMGVPADMTIRPRGFWSFLKPGKLKVADAALAHLLFTAPREYRPRALELAKRPGLAGPLAEIPWDQVRMIQFQEGAGVSLRFPPAAVLAVTMDWLSTQTAPLFDMLLLF